MKSHHTRSSQHMTVVVICVLLLNGLMVTAHAAEPSDSQLAAFVLPWDDAEPGPTSLAFLNHVPAGKFGPIHAGPGGHLYAGNERIRFLGVNVCFGANVPEQHAATRIAARMAKFGINVVRFHHADGRPFPSGLIRKGPGSGDLDPQAMDRLAFFISELKKNGIYSNLNLLVSRAFGVGDGLPAEIDQISWKLRHAVGIFYVPMIEMQKRYARDLLTYRNPHTGMRLGDDPAIAFVEINNENGLLQHWLENDLDELPGKVGEDLTRQWNAWLQTRYANTPSLQKAWQVSPQPLGPELVASPTATESSKRGKWALEQHEGAVARLSIERNAAGQHDAVRIQVEKASRESWHVQFNHPKLKVKANGIYTVSFRARANSDRNMTVMLGQAHEPWHGLGFDVKLKLTSQWQDFKFSMIASPDDNARLSFTSLANQTGTLWLADISLRPGGNIGLEPDETIENKRVPIIRRTGCRSWPEAARRDFAHFLWDTENRYWEVMRRYVKEDLQFKGVVIGTIVGCSTPNLQAPFDAADGHAYWRHPHFPGKPWDPEDWIVRNDSMVNETGGVLAGLSMERIAGKPFTVTEYNHASPNTYSSEAPLLLAAHAAFQDWDGIYLFAYAHGTGWDAQRIDGFFDIGQHPAKMANMVAAAMLYRAAHVHAGREQIIRSVDSAGELELILKKARAWRQVSLDYLGVDSAMSLVHRTAIQTGTPADLSHPAMGPEDSARLVSDTGQVTWDRSKPGKGVVLINSPRSKAVIGFVAGRSFLLGDVTITPGETLQDWCTMCLSLVEGDSFTTSGRALLVATGYTQNTDMCWKDSEHTSVGRRWGKAPSRVEVVHARLSLPAPPDRLEVWALNERGQRTSRITVRTNSDGGSLIEIGNAHTLWYELVIK